MIPRVDLEGCFLNLDYKYQTAGEHVQIPTISFLKNKEPDPCDWFFTLYEISGVRHLWLNSMIEALWGSQA